MDPPDFLEAAKRAQSAFKPPDWSQFLYSQFAFDRSSIDEDTLSQARQIWDMGSSIVITTNYDSVLEWSSPGSQAVTWHIENRFGLARFIDGTHKRPTVWHLHGQIEHPDELILSPDGYARLYASGTPGRTGEKYEAALAALRTVLATRRLLFVGFSFADAAFAKQLEWLRETFGGQSGPHYAFIHRDRFEEVARALRDVDVECVYYPDHGPGLSALLCELSQVASVDASFVSPQPGERPTQLNSKLIQKGTTAQDWFPDCAKMSVDGGGQGDTAKSSEVLLDLRFGRGQLKRIGLTLQYSISEAALLYDLGDCTWDGPRLGDGRQHPCLIPEPSKWRIVGPLDNQGTLAGSAILNEALGRIRASSEQHTPAVTDDSFVS